MSATTRAVDVLDAVAEALYAPVERWPNATYAVGLVLIMATTWTETYLISATGFPEIILAFAFAFSVITIAMPMVETEDAERYLLISVLLVAASFAVFLMNLVPAPETPATDWPIQTRIAAAIWVAGMYSLATAFVLSVGRRGYASVMSWYQSSKAIGAEEVDTFDDRL